VGKVFLAALLLSCTGCVELRRPGFVIPSRCIAISLQSFTQPCESRRDGKFVCNGVAIAANCVAPGRERHVGSPDGIY
jgi:hypothetical protein